VSAQASLSMLTLSDNRLRRFYDIEPDFSAAR
jgi:hypothetical protein